MYFVKDFFISLRYFKHLDATSKVTDRHEIIRTGNPVELTMLCFQWLSRNARISALFLSYLLWFQLQELRGNIRVFARCRYDDSTKCCLQFPSDHEILAPTGRKAFKFDKVFPPTSSQEEVGR